MSDEKKEVIPETPETTDLSPEEQEMAKSHNLVKKDESSSTQDKPKTEDKTKVEDKTVIETKIEDIDPSKLTPEQEIELTKTFNDREKGQYVRMKSEHAKRQQAESERDFLKVKLDALSREVELLKKSPTPVKEEETSIFDDPDSDKPVTKADLLKLEEVKAQKVKEEQAKLQEQQAIIEAINKRVHDNLNMLEQEVKIKNADKYPQLDKVIELAGDVLKTRLQVSKKLQRQYVAFLEAAYDPEHAEESPVDIMYEIGKTHPKFAEIMKETSEKTTVVTDDKNKVKKIVENADKRTSSAAVGAGGSGSAKVSEEDLTADDVASMTDKEWNALKKSTRQRLLKEIQ